MQRPAPARDPDAEQENDDLVTLLTMLPWWANLLLALLAYVFLFVGVPAILGGRPFARAFAPALNILAVAAAGLFILGAGLPFLAANRKRRLLDRQAGLDSIRALSWGRFKELVAEAYRRDGYRLLENEQPGPDDGVDIRLRRDGELHLVKCKNWRSRRVGVGVVRGVYGVLAAERAHQATIVSSGHFTQEARRFAARKPVRLVDGKRLLALVHGVQRDQDNRPSRPGRYLPSEAAEAPNVCPRCGGRLVVRTTKRGRHSGRSFLGCETFPLCRHTQNLSGR